MINTISITRLKQNTTSIINALKDKGEPVVVLQRSEPAAVIVDPEYYRMLEDALEEKEDLKAIHDRENEPIVSSEDVAQKLGLL